MSIKKNRLLSLLLVVLVIALLGGCAATEPAPESSSPAAPAEGTEKAEEVEPIVLRYAANYTELHPQAIADIAWMEKIEKETDGKVKFEPYWGGALMSMDQPTSSSPRVWQMSRSFSCVRQGRF